MKRLLLLLFPVSLFAQVNDATLNSRNDLNIRQQTTSQFRSYNMFLDIIASKVNTLAPRLTTSSTSGYVWTATDNQGNGSWQVSGGSVSLPFFPVGPSNGTDDKAAIDAAVALAKANGSGAVYFSSANYYITQKLDYTDLKNIHFVGNGTTINSNFVAGDIIYIHASSTPPELTQGLGNQGVIFDGVNMYSSVKKTSGFAIHIEWSYDFEYSHGSIGRKLISIYPIDGTTNNMYSGIYADKEAQMNLHDFNISASNTGILVTAANAVQTDFAGYFNYDGAITNFEMFGDGSPGSRAIHFGGGVGGCRIDGYGNEIFWDYGMIIDKTITGVTNFDITISNAFFDTNVTGGLYVAASSLNSLQVTGGWFSAMGSIPGALGAGGAAQYGVFIENQGSTNLAQAFTFTGTQFRVCRGDGLKMLGGRRLVLVGNSFNQLGQGASGGNGVDLTGMDIIVATDNVFDNIGNATKGTAFKINDTPTVLDVAHNSYNTFGVAGYAGPAGNSVINGSVTLTGVSAPAYAQGKLVYSIDDQNLKFYNNDANVGMDIGQENWVRVVNSSGASIPNGSLVYKVSASGGYPTIALARSNATTTSEVYGITTETIGIGATGFITTFGEVHGLNTNAFTLGADLYLDPTTAGAFTSTAPTSPNMVVKIGTVTAVSTTVGSVMIVTAPKDIFKIGNNALTVTTTGSTGVQFPTSGTLYGTATGSITSAQLAASLTDETGTGLNVMQTSPTFITPILGAATGTSLGLSGNISLTSIGAGLAIKTGTNARTVQATLSGGTITVNNTSVTSNTIIIPSCHTPAGTVGFLYNSTRVNGTSFTITSSSGTDTSLIDVILIEIIP